mmetsp:Transcript_72935/g.89458  ORF Transcript_72935/g.89458 Transcript_72935/m.89458 type:complete len:300 (+) Transcript_72935:29-928(+)
MSQIQYTFIGNVSTGKCLLETNLGFHNSVYVKIAKKILKKISKNELKKPDGMATLLSGEYGYNYIFGFDNNTTNDINSELLGNIVFLCANESINYNDGNNDKIREIIYNFLNDVKNEFISQFSGDLDVLMSSDTNKFDNDITSDLNLFSASIKDKMINMPTNDNNFDYQKKGKNVNNSNKMYGTNLKTKMDLRRQAPKYINKNSQINNVINQIEQVKQTVKENIEMVIDRGEDMALLHDKSQSLMDDSVSFRNKSRQIRYQYCKDLYKQRCVLIFIIIFVVYLLSAMICGWRWGSCSSK